MEHLERTAVWFNSSKNVSTSFTEDSRTPPDLLHNCFQREDLESFMSLCPIPMLAPRAREALTFEQQPPNIKASIPPTASH